MPNRIPDKQLSRLDLYINGWLGLHFPKKRWRDLERIIVHTAPELGFHDTATCIERLVSGQFSKAQQETLASCLTIGETYFFREPKSFDALEKRILPGLIASRRGRDQRLRIWSAGCSTGEEPYSLAILLNQLLPDIRDWQITILATDINTRALAAARQGVYREWSFRGVPEWVRQRYFTTTAGGLFELQHAIRRMVTFSVLNLAEDSYPSLSNTTNAMDIIFCRNVLMYFAPKQQQQVIQGFRRSLLDDGWLVVSPCEASPAFSACFETVMFPGGALYKKGEQTARPIVMSVPDMAAGAGAGAAPPREPVRLPEPPPPAVPVHARQPVPDKAHQVSVPAESQTYEEAQVLYREGRYGEAADRLSRLLECGEGAAGAAQWFGKAAALKARVLANQGHIVPALEWTEKAIAVDKLNAELYYLRATIFQEQGGAAAAITSLKQALYLDHDYVPAHFSLGTLTLQEGKHKEARKHFGNALSLLGPLPQGDPVPGVEGMTVGRLAEIITSIRSAMG